MKALYSVFSIIIFLSTVSSCKVDESESIDQFRIVYNVYAPDSLNDSNYEVFIMDTNGKNKTNLTSNPDVAWSYMTIGNKVYFVSDRGNCLSCYTLFSMNNDGLNVQRISNLRLKDSWMSHRFSGSEIVVTPHPLVDSAFHILDRNGEFIKRLFVDLPSISDPVFSPDGKVIAFRGGTKKSKRAEGYEEAIYIINDDGSDLKKLTTYPKADSTAPWFTYKAGPPKWHPSGEYITYQSYQNGGYSLFAVTPDGEKHWKLTDITWQEGYHDWSLDGKWLAIELFDSLETQFNIGLLNWDTKNLQVLTDSTYKYQQAPSFVRK